MYNSNVSYSIKQFCLISLTVLMHTFSVNVTSRIVTYVVIVGEYVELGEDFKTFEMKLINDHIGNNISYSLNCKTSR